MGKKSEEFTMSADAALAHARSIIEDLASEMAEWRDNMEEKLSATAKYEEVSEAADTLDNALNECPEEAPDGWGTLVFTQDTRKRQARSTRLSNAIEALYLFQDGPDEGEPNDEQQAFMDEIQCVLDYAEAVEFPGMY